MGASIAPPPLSLFLLTQPVPIRPPPSWQGTTRHHTAPHCSTLPGTAEQDETLTWLYTHTTRCKRKIKPSNNNNNTSVTILYSCNTEINTRHTPWRNFNYGRQGLIGDAGWRRLIGSLNFIGHFLQK